MNEIHKIFCFESAKSTENYKHWLKNVRILFASRKFCVIPQNLSPNRKILLAWSKKSLKIAFRVNYITFYANMTVSAENEPNLATLRPEFAAKF